ncbi:MAG: phospholipase D-like domain-containing protein [Desulfobacterales bacterium]
MSIGSANFLKGGLLAQLKAGGVVVAFALPVSALSVFKVRPDLRLHRKIVVIDDVAAYTGSFNLVDPRFFKQDAERGVRVTVIMPERNDSRLVHYTCRSYFDDMLAAGIRIFGFKGGLLHTKSVVVDRQVALFGSVNLDIRSFWLDFEVTLGVYDPDFAERLLALQDTYIGKSVAVDLQIWRQRPGKERFIENLARLASPLL